jgi:hypothetical protein
MIIETDQTQGTRLVLTNQHVIDGAQTIVVIASDSVAFEGVLRGEDVERDLAIVEFCCDFKTRAVLFGHSESVNVGEIVFALGYALGLPGEATVTQGIVSATRSDGDLRILIQTDAPINSGNSGGPLFNREGLVIGINTLVIRDAGGAAAVEGFGFAVSEATITDVLGTLRGSGFVTGGTTSSGYQPLATSGVLVHDRSVEISNTLLVEEELTAGLVEVSFENPYRPENGSWSYGFLIWDAISNTMRAFMVTSQRAWHHYEAVDADDEAWEELDSGLASSVTSDVSSSNFLRLMILGRTWFLFANGVHLATLDLGGLTAPYYVELIHNFFQGDGINGYVTPYSGLHYEEWDQIEADVDGSIERKEGFIGVSDALGRPANFYVESTFTNPVSDTNDSWSYGMLYRHSGFEEAYVTMVRSDGEYYHIRLRGEDFSRQGQINKSVRSQAGFDTSDGAINKVAVVATEGFAWLLVNDVVVERLGVAANVNAGTLRLVAGYFTNDQEVGSFTEFSQLNAWAP